jgi:hypothetical protein
MDFLVVAAVYVVAAFGAALLAGRFLAAGRQREDPTEPRRQ